MEPYPKVASSMVSIPTGLELNEKLIFATSTNQTLLWCQEHGGGWQVWPLVAPRCRQSPVRLQLTLCPPQYSYVKTLPPNHEIKRMSLQGVAAAPEWDLHPCEWKNPRVPPSLFCPGMGPGEVVVVGQWHTVRKRTWNQAAAPTRCWIFQHLDLRFPNLLYDKQCNNNAFTLLKVTQSVAFGIAASGD